MTNRLTENQEKARGIMDMLHAMEAQGIPQRPALDAPELLAAVQLAYRKHHLGDDSIGWDELSEKLGDVLCEAMGDTAFVEWMRSARKGP